MQGTKGQNTCPRMRLILTDQDIAEYFRILGIASMDQFPRISKVQRDDIIKQVMKLESVIIRQLARMIGLSKSIIDRI